MTNVKDFGAIGNGIADDTIAIRNALNACPEGGTVYFEPGKTYISNPLVSKNASVIDLQGSTLRRKSPFSSSGGGTLLDLNVKSNINYSNLNIQVLKNENKFTAPNINAQIGDLVLFNSIEIHTLSDSGNYTHGQYSVITNIDNNTYYLSTPFYDNYTVNSITISKVNPSISIINGILDGSQTPNESISNTVLRIIGVNISVKNIIFKGSYYSGTLMSVGGENAIIENCHFNTCRGKKYGYGTNLIGNNLTVQNSIYTDCKHAFTSAARKTVAIKLTLRDSIFFESDIDPAGSNFTGTIDYHSGVAGVCVIDNVEVYSFRRFLQTRSKMAEYKIYNSKFTIMRNTTNIDSCITGGEVDLANLSFYNCKFNLTDNCSLFRTNADAFSSEINNIILDSCTINKGSILKGQMPIKNSVIRNCEINQNECIVTTWVPSGNKQIENFKFHNNNFVGIKLFQFMIRQNLSTIGLYITNNVIKRSNNNEEESFITIRSTSEVTKAFFDDINISNNSFIYDNNDNTIEKTIFINNLQIDSFTIANNTIKRKNNNADIIYLNNTSISNGSLIGNNLSSGKITFTAHNNLNNTLSDFIVIGNNGSSYNFIAENGSTINKINYKFFFENNNFKVINDNSLDNTNNYIIESGANENGEFICFADGTQICRRSVSIDSTITTVTSINFKFPKPFIGEYSGSFSGGNRTGTPFVKALAQALGIRVRNQEWQILNLGTEPTSGVWPINLIAIGRWKN
jgi:hypothetical protein